MKQVQDGLGGPSIMLKGQENALFTASFFD